MDKYSQAFQFIKTIKPIFLTNILVDAGVAFAATASTTTNSTMILKIGSGHRSKSNCEIIRKLSH